MPALKNQRQERFCQLLRQGIPPYRAYPAAGYNPHHYSPYRLRDNAAVKRRIAELSRGLAMKTRITVETLLSDLAEDRALARDLGQPSAAISAVQLSARLVGLLVDRKETGAPGEFAGLQSEAEVLDAVRTELGEGAAAALAASLAQQAAAAEPVDQAASAPQRAGDGTLN